MLKTPCEAGCRQHVHFMDRDESRVRNRGQTWSRPFQPPSDSVEMRREPGEVQALPTPSASVEMMEGNEGGSQTVVPTQLLRRVSNCL